MLPPPLRDYFLAMVEEEQSPAYVIVGSDGAVLEFGGDTPAYGLDRLRRGQPYADECPFLVGMLPTTGTALVVPDVDVGRGRPAHIHLIPDARGDIVLLRDSSRAAAARQEVQQTANELALLREQQARLIQDLDAFAHTVAHDLRDPLTAVTGYAELLMDDEKTETGRPRRELQEILNSVERMGRIIEELLLLAGVSRSTVERHELDMAAVVTGALDRLKTGIQASGAVVSIPERWPRATGYAPWIEEVWANYISNAIKYGGAPPCVTLGAETAGGIPTFWVQDNGPGVAPEMRERLFTAHVGRGSVRAKGHGLGLSIVRRIVEKLGGQVGVSDVPGGGARFQFTLPPADTAPVD